MSNFEIIYELKNALWNQLYTSWISEELFSFPWWFSVLFLLAGYIVWWKVLDKSRLIELLLFGALLAVMAAVTDTVADNLSLWQYRVKIFPFAPAFFPFHLTITPLIMMIAYQYTDNWRSFFIGTVLAAAVYSFVIAPLFVAVGEVRLLKWNHGYTFIVSIMRAAIARWVVLLCRRIQEQQEFSRPFGTACRPVAKPLPDKEDIPEKEADK